MGKYYAAFYHYKLCSNNCCLQSATFLCQTREQRFLVLILIIWAHPVCTASLTPLSTSYVNIIIHQGVYFDDPWSHVVNLFWFLNAVTATINDERQKRYNTLSYETMDWLFVFTTFQNAMTELPSTIGALMSAKRRDYLLLNTWLPYLKIFDPLAKNIIV